MGKSYAHCFVGPEPMALDAYDSRVLLNGRPVRTAFRIVSEGNYQRIMQIVERSGENIDEMVAP